MGIWPNHCLFFPASAKSPLKKPGMHTPGTWANYVQSRQHIQELLAYSQIKFSSIEFCVCCCSSLSYEKPCTCFNHSHGVVSRSVWTPPAPPEDWKACLDGAVPSHVHPLKWLRESKGHWGASAQRRSHLSSVSALWARQCRRESGRQGPGPQDANNCLQHRPGNARGILTLHSMSLHIIKCANARAVLV